MTSAKVTHRARKPPPGGAAAWFSAEYAEPRRDASLPEDLQEILREARRRYAKPASRADTRKTLVDLAHTSDAELRATLERLEQVDIWTYKQLLLAEEFLWRRHRPKLGKMPAGFYDRRSWDGPHARLLARTALERLPRKDGRPKRTMDGRLLAELERYWQDAHKPGVDPGPFIRNYDRLWNQFAFERFEADMFKSATDREMLEKTQANERRRQGRKMLGRTQAPRRGPMAHPNEGKKAIKRKG